MVEAVRVLSGYAEQCCQGQIDEQTRSSATCSEREYLTLARNKTASQFAAAAQLGAILVGASKEDVDALGAYGLALGTAFQIQDDALDLLGNADTLGKPIGNSLALGRPNLAVIYLWEYGSEAARAKYRQMERSRAPLEEFAQLLVEEGMVELACAMQKQHSDQALETLERLSRPEGRAALAAFNRYLSSWGLSQMRGRNAPASSTCRDSL